MAKAHHIGQTVPIYRVGAGGCGGNRVNYELREGKGGQWRGRGMGACWWRE